MDRRRLGSGTQDHGRRPASGRADGGSANAGVGDEASIPPSDASPSKQLSFDDAAFSSVDDEIRLLHVDDDASFLALVEAFLDRLDVSCTVRTETDPERALTEGISDVDCIVSDYEMPTIDGLEFLKRVRERRPELPFVLFTGRGSEEIASDAISAGVTDYLQKGGGTDRYEMLANRVRNAVERRRSEQALTESRRRLATLVSHLPGMAYRCEPRPPWNMTFVGGDSQAVTGHDPETLVTGEVRFGDVIHEADRDHVDDVVTDAIRSERSFEIEYRTRFGSTVVAVRENGEPVFDDGEVIAVEGFVMPLDTRETDSE